ncbi:Hypothetical predicted protein [Prunus dulcis]|uniref:Uncharacterized protein n=1 Tax=Prunus dulcis TaxID=3755 RepID=A0A5E4FS40_PRUDU|nr:Hypothetical predicted protein [Prunus dulcis]
MENINQWNNMTHLLMGLANSFNIYSVQDALRALSPVRASSSKKGSFFNGLQRPRPMVGATKLGKPKSMSSRRSCLRAGDVDADAKLASV